MKPGTNSVALSTRSGRVHRGRAFARRRERSWLALALTLTLTLAGAVSVGGALGNSGARAAEPPKDVVVFAAASLKEAFGKLAERFQGEHPGIRVVINTAGSQELRTQLEHGAVADVFASADRKYMDGLMKQGLVASSSVFACNEPVVVIRPALAARIKVFPDLPRADRIVIGTPEVPIGNYTLEILRKAVAAYGADFPARVQAKVASRELNVKQVLAKVSLGEADAGIVYRGDATAATGKGKVQILEIPSAVNVMAEYPIAPLKAAPRPELARLWIDLVNSSAGAMALGEAGFISCPRR